VESEHRVGLGRAGSEASSFLRERAPRLLILVLACAACVVVLWTCKEGVGLRSDSAVYVAAARNLLDGKGLSWLSGGGEIRPLTLHAPLLPILLAGVEAVGIDGIAWARWLNAVCLGLDVFLVGALIQRFTHSPWFALLGALITAVTGELFQVHVWLMSEPLFIPLMLGGVLALHTYSHRGGRFWLILAAIALGLAALTRYAGLALPLVGIAFLWIDPRSSWKRRAVEAGWMLTLGLVPVLAWMLRNAILTGQTGGRAFGPNLALWPSVRDQAMSILLNWFAPLGLVESIMARPILVALVLCSAVLVITLAGGLLLRKSTRLNMVSDPRRSGPMLMLLCVAALLGVLFSAALFSSPGADVDERVLSPCYPLLLVVVVEALAWLWGKRSAALKVGVVLLVVLFLRNKAMFEYWAIRGSMGGLGYASPTWRASATIREIIAMDPGVIYTNDTAAMYLLANRSSYWVPWALPGYDPALAAQAEVKMNAVLLKQDGAVVLFGNSDLPVGWSGASLKVKVQTDDGVILLPESGEPG